MNTRALKFKAVHFAVDAYLGEDDNGISILDRVVGAVKRAKKRDIPHDHALREATREIDKMEEFNLSDSDLHLALDAAVILLEG
jgi:hypothetical protein